eukprot:Gb_20295 [translate_table: standard]
MLLLHEVVIVKEEKEEALVIAHHKRSHNPLRVFHLLCSSLGQRYVCTISDPLQLTKTMMEWRCSASGVINWRRLVGPEFGEHENIVDWAHARYADYDYNYLIDLALLESMPKPR